MLNEASMSLSSSFGPLGWRKIVSNEGGSTIITKDGQLIASSMDCNADGALVSLLWKDVILAAEKSGDGVITNSMMVVYAVNYMDGRLSASFGSRIRIRLLRVVEALHWVTCQHEATIRSALIDINVWATIVDIESRVVGLVQSIAVPSSNSGVATDVADILVRSSTDHVLSSTF